MRDEDYPLSTIREVVAKQIKYPNTDPATGAPGMPANLVTGSDVDDIAAYVACAAGIPVKEAEEAGCGTAGSGTGGRQRWRRGGGGGAGSADGKAIFTDNGLRELPHAGGGRRVRLPSARTWTSRRSTRRRDQQIENGGGVMPAFKDQLSEEQIKAVAHFVVTSR